MAKENKNDLMKDAESSTVQIDGAYDRGLQNRETGQSLIFREDGSMNLITGKYSQFKIDSDSGVVTTAALQSNDISVQRDIITDDLSINKHKLNNQLFELTNFKKLNNGAVIGGFTAMGTVLVKAWEPTLKKYVLIRRQMRTPVFSNVLDPYKVSEQLEVDPNVAKDIADYKISKEDKKKNK